MTSTSVKDLTSIMTFVGAKASSQTKSSEFGMSFGDMMTKAEAGATKTDVGSAQTNQSKTEVGGFKKKVEETNQVRPQDASKETDKVETSEGGMEANGVSDEVKVKLDDAGKKILSEVAKELDVSEETVLEAMEVLGLSMISLLEPSNLGQLVLEVRNETDPIALVTNENLFNSVKDLTTIVDATLADLAEDMDMEVPDVRTIIQQVEVENEQLSEMEMSVKTNLDLNEVKEPQVEVSKEVVTEDGTSTQNITISADGRSAEVTVVKTNESEEDGGHDTGRREHADRSEIHAQQTPTGTAALDNLVSNLNEISTPETPEPFTNSQTVDIMNQIMERMRVSVKPDMDELEMQLHPASLGTVKVNLTANKAGEVTAEFKVQNEVVKAAVEAQLNDLRETFKAQGTKVTEIEVSVEMQSFDSNLWQGKERDTNENSKNNSRRNRRINLNDLDALFADEATDEEKLAAEMMEANGNTVDFTA